ncbi:MAG: response regulator [Caulobacteraceae bacterium]|nr:response regulator [Caulobacteraceae bacterium]
MTASDNRHSRTLAAHLSTVLLLDSSVAGSRVTQEILKGLGAGRIVTETSDERALALCRQIEPKIIITELRGPALDGLKFVRALRRSSFTCRKAPVIVITAQATASSLTAARNAGAHEFMCKPFTIRDLTRRLEAVAIGQRDWIEAVSYVGPDRRRFNSGDYRGPRKRIADAGGVGARMEQALRILAAAVKAIDSDAAQALRAMRAQSVDLAAIATSTNDTQLMADVATLQRCLAEASASGQLSRAQVEAGVADLLARLPAEKPQAEQTQARVA